MKQQLLDLNLNEQTNAPSLCQPTRYRAPQQYLLTQHVWLPRHAGQIYVRPQCNYTTNTQHGDKLPPKPRGVSGRRGIAALPEKMLPWRAWDEPPEPMTLMSWESTTPQPKTGTVHDLIIYGKIIWHLCKLPGTPIDWSFVGDMCEDSRPLWLWRLRMMGFAGSLEVPVAWMFQCRSDVMCLSRPILQLVAKIIKKEREKCRFLKISQIENMSRCRVWWSRNLGLTS